MTKTAYPLVKQIDSDMLVAPAAKPLINQLCKEGELAPKTLALVRESHLQESSISLMPKTGKAGVFEIERSHNSSKNIQSQYQSLYQLPTSHNRIAEASDTS